MSPLGDALFPCLGGEGEVRGLAEPRERVLLELADPLARETEPAADLLERDRAVVREAEAELDHAPLPLRKRGHRLPDRLAAQQLVRLLVRGGLLGRDELADCRSTVITDGLVEDGRGQRRLERLVDVLELEAA